MYNGLRMVELKCYLEQLPATIKAMISPFDECVYISVLATLLQKDKRKVVYYHTDKKQQVQLYVNYIRGEIKYYISGCFQNE